MIYCLKPEMYPTPEQTIEEISYRDENDFEWKIARVEKRIATTMYAQASTLKEAVEVIENGMKGTLADYEIVSLTETNILDIFKYDAR